MIADLGVVFLFTGSEVFRLGGTFPMHSPLCPPLGYFLYLSSLLALPRAYTDTRVVRQCVVLGRHVLEKKVERSGKEEMYNTIKLSN